MSSKCVRWGDTRCSFAYRFTLQCDTICRAFGLRSWIPIVIWCDYCLLVALWFLFHIELAKSLPFRFRSSDLIPKFELQKTLWTRRKRSGAPHASLVYNRVVAWVVWKNLCFFVWYFVMTVMLAFASSVCRHSAHGMAKDLAHRQLSLYPHAIDCMAKGNASKGSRSPSLPTYKYAWRVMCVCNNYSS